MSELISVIIPVYNVEKYLDRCMDTVINQTYQQLEIILVDDGSTDSSPEKCNQWKQKDSRIIVIHKDNGGLSSARNAGLEIATGRYVLFIDSDDCVNIHICQKLHQMISESGADIAIGSPYKFSDTPPSDTVTKQFSAVDKQYALEQIATDYKWVVAWGKLYKRELFDDISFSIGKLHEDEFIIHELYYKSTKIAYTDDLLYYYFFNTGGITGQKFNIRRMDVFEALNNRLLFYQKHNEKNLYNLTIVEIIQMMTNYSKLMKDYGDKTLLTKMRADCRQLIKSHRKVCHISIWDYPKVYTFAYPASIIVAVPIRVLKKLHKK